MSALIGITAGEIYNSHYDWSPVVHGQSHTYVDAIVRSNATPIIIPLIQNQSTLKDLYERLDGILFAGGNDINPKLYGERAHPATEITSDIRDSTELELMRWALQDKKPILCICRGMQLLNVACGGSLHQHLPDVLSVIDHEASTHQKSGKYLAHQLTLIPDSRLAMILGTNNIEANSHHHQGIKVLGEKLIACGHSDDSLIEAIEYKTDTFAIGVQPHPEALEYDVEPRWHKLFEAFIDSCEK